MAANLYPSGTTTIRNLTPRYTYFLVVRNTPKSLTDLPLIDYFIYQYIVSVSADRGISDLTTSGTISVVALSDLVYSSGSFIHPKYTNQTDSSLQIPYIEILIRQQTTIGVVDTTGSPPTTSTVIPEITAKS